MRVLPTRLAVLGGCLLSTLALATEPALARTTSANETAVVHAAKGGFSPFEWTLPAGTLEARTSVGVSHFYWPEDPLIGVFPRSSPTGSLVLSAALTDHLQLALTHRLAPSVTLRFGDRDAPFQGAASLGLTSFAFWTPWVLGLDAFAELQGGLRLAPRWWLIGGLRTGVALAPADFLATSSGLSTMRAAAKAGVVIDLHPRLRVQLGLAASYQVSPNSELNGPWPSVDLGSVLGLGVRPLPLLQWQLLPDLSLDGHATASWLLDGTGIVIQAYQVGFTWSTQ